MALRHTGADATHEVISGLVHEFFEMLGDGEAYNLLVASCWDWTKTFSALMRAGANAKAAIAFMCNPQMQQTSKLKLKHLEEEFPFGFHDF